MKKKQKLIQSAICVLYLTLAAVVSSVSQVTFTQIRFDTINAQTMHTRAHLAIIYI